MPQKALFGPEHFEELKKYIREVLEELLKKYLEESFVSALIKSLEKINLKIIEVLEKHNMVLDEMCKSLEKISFELNKIEERMENLERALHGITLSLEEEANTVVTSILKNRGFEVSTKPIVIDEEYEFDIFGVFNGYVVIGEVKTRAGPKTVEKLVERIEKVKALYPDKIPGKVIPVLYCLRAIPGTVEKAEELGIWLIESGFEKTKLKL